jgi:hypothetical protein
MLKSAIDYTDGKSAKRPRRTRPRARVPRLGGRGGGIKGRVLAFRIREVSGEGGEGRQMQFGGKKQAETRVGRRGDTAGSVTRRSPPPGREGEENEREGGENSQALNSKATHTHGTRGVEVPRSKSHPRRDAYSHLRRTGAAGVLRAQIVSQQRKGWRCATAKCKQSCNEK